MKKKIIPAAVALALALIIAVGSQTFLQPCVHEDGSFGACHWAGQALLGLGCVMGALAALALALPRARLGLYIAMLPVSVMGLLTPGTLIDLCRMSTMRCRAVMRPAMLILFAAALAVSALGAALNARK
ncbi:MAG: DUF4418 family protein [Clostridia bacterium]|nr:DUF4418 family protein [Clostridia bacterium]